MQSILDGGSVRKYSYVRTLGHRQLRCTVPKKKRNKMEREGKKLFLADCGRLERVPRPEPFRRVQRECATQELIPYMNTEGEEGGALVSKKGQESDDPTTPNYDGNHFLRSKNVEEEDEEKFSAVSKCLDLSLIHI